VEILLVSGIWPPDVGGPASHGPEFGRFLVDRGHRVRAVTSAGSAGPEDPGFPVVASRNDRPRLVRQPAAALTLIAAARQPDVIYATGMYGRSALAASLRRVPLVFKLVSDPAYERARRLGLFSGTLEEFQRSNGHPAVPLLKRLRDLTLARASRIVIPSRYLADIAHAWGIPAERIRIIPNPAPHIEASPTRDQLRERLGVRSPTFVFAGRLTAQKNLPLAISALRHVPRGSLVVIGTGSASAELQRAIIEAGVGDRVTVKGGLPRREAVAWMRAADATVLSSDWENFPHAAVEALTVGTPVIATAVGGLPEIVSTGVNGILVPPRDPLALGDAMCSVARDSELLARLREGALATADRYRPRVSYEAIEKELEWAGRRSIGRADRGAPGSRP
jgi:glycosyltransferase involved in cell wall biosynthesis